MRIGLTLNGRPVEREIPPGQTLLYFLRDCALFSVKLGCESGDCGSCTVLLDGRPVNSCVVPAAKANGASVTTLEGLLADPLIRRLQEQLVAKDAVQCGYCTPGMLISLYALLQEDAAPTELEIREALSGNLCRCTAYVKPIEAVQAVIAAKTGEQAGDHAGDKDSLQGGGRP